MKLTRVHQLLIVMAMALAAVFALRSLHLAVTNSSLQQGVQALLAAAAAVALWWYLQGFRRKLASAKATERKDG